MPVRLDRLILCFAGSLLLCQTVGCGFRPASRSESPPPEAVRSEKVLGPVRLIVEVSAAEIRLSDEPTLTLTVRAESGVEVETPPFGESVGEFLIRDYREPLPSADGDIEITRQIYVLEPTHAGTLTIAPIALTFHDQRPQGDHKQHTIESEAIQVEVTTIVGDAAPTLSDLRPAAPPRELPSEGPPAVVWVTLLVILAAAAVFWWRRQRRQPEFTEQQLSPRQLAELEINQIVERRLAETDVKAFYAEVTGVVRRYIERSTGVKAPEQTTEEFLREILDRDLFSDIEQRQLRQFLESADLVKFAGHQPETTDIDRSIDRAREFTQREKVSEEAST